MTTTIMSDGRRAAAKAQKAPASETKKPADRRLDKKQMPCPPEGPHARPELINEDATPGAGLFSGGHKSADKDVDPGAG